MAHLYPFMLSERKHLSSKSSLKPSRSGPSGLFPGKPSRLFGTDSVGSTDSSSLRIASPVRVRVKGLRFRDAFGPRRSLHPVFACLSGPRRKRRHLSSAFSEGASGGSAPPLRRGPDDESGDGGARILEDPTSPVEGGARGADVVDDDEPPSPDRRRPRLPAEDVFGKVAPLRGAAAGLAGAAVDPGEAVDDGQTPDGREPPGNEKGLIVAPRASAMERQGNEAVGGGSLEGPSQGPTERRAEGAHPFVF